MIKLDDFYIKLRLYVQFYNVNPNLMLIDTEKLKIELQNGRYPKECDIDYKIALTKKPDLSGLEIFLFNFFIDILSFSNSDGGVLLLGIKEDKSTGEKEEVGLNEPDLNLLQKIELNEISKKISAYTKVEPLLDLQPFNIGSRKCYYLLINKSEQVLIPNKDENKFKIKKGEIRFRKSGENTIANENTSKLSDFISRKANERSKDYLDIWRDLIPSMVEIHPKDIIIINPKENKIYGFNKESKLITIPVNFTQKDGATKEDYNVVFNVINKKDILGVSSEGGKDAFRIVNDIELIDSQHVRTREVEKERINFTSAVKEIQRLSGYKFSSVDFKKLCFYKKISTNDDFTILDNRDRKVDSSVILDENYIFSSVDDKVTKTRRIYATQKCIDEFTEIIKDKNQHMAIFNKELLEVELINDT